MAINIYKTISESKTGITEEELVFEDGRLTHQGEAVILDQELSGSAIRE